MKRLNVWTGDFKGKRDEAIKAWEEQMKDRMEDDPYGAAEWLFETVKRMITVPRIGKAAMESDLVDALDRKWEEEEMKERGGHGCGSSQS